jgi:hypothetical protein
MNGSTQAARMNSPCSIAAITAAARRGKSGASSPLAVSRILSAVLARASVHADMPAGGKERA